MALEAASEQSKIAAVNVIWFLKKNYFGILF